MAHDKFFAVKQPRHTNKSGLAVLFGVTVDTVTRWHKLGIPVESRGVYDVRACVAWYKMTSKVGPGPTDGGQEQSANLRLALAKAEKQERENETAMDSLISREVFSSYVQFLGTLFTNTIESIGARLANQLASIDDPAECQLLVWEEGREARRTMVQKLKDIELGSLFPDDSDK